MAYSQAMEVATVDGVREGGCMCCDQRGSVIRIAAGNTTRMVIRLCTEHARELRARLGEELSEPVKATDRHLLESLDVEAIGPTGLAARFSAVALRRFIRERGQKPKGNKVDLALQLSRLLKAGQK